MKCVSRLPLAVMFGLGVGTLRAAEAQIVTPKFYFTLPDKFKVVNIVPNDRSGETNRDAEPNLAVNPALISQIAASAFTPSNGYCADSVAPIYVSADTGSNWALNCIIPSDSAGTGTSDITLRFGSAGNRLYAGILRRPSLNNDRLNILRTTNYLSNNLMQVLVDRTRIDQPYVQAVTSSGNDLLVVGDNDFAGALRTATIDASLNAAAAPPAFNTSRLEVRATSGQDGPPIRPAVHSNGQRIYAAFYGWRARAGTMTTTDVVVVRDDNGGSGAAPFTALTDPSDGLVGRLVVTGRRVPFNNANQPNFGQERFVGSNLSIAVSPLNDSVVYVAWADSAGANQYTLHVRRSLDAGQTWDAADRRTVPSATNPALAISSGGIVGFLYQELSGVAPNARWITQLERTSNGFATFSSDTLATVPSNVPVGGRPYNGDYIHLMSVGRTFFGIFSANNTPNNTNFPRGVRYLRNANFTTNNLLANDNITVVPISIDPFFFSVTPGRVFRICDMVPRLCDQTRFDGPVVVLKCYVTPCLRIDPLPKNCTVKFRCPPCPAGYCPPFYHLFLDDLDPAIWLVDLIGPDGQPFPHEQIRTDRGVVISFRPERRTFRERDIGDYSLVFRMSPKGTVGTEYRIPTRLEIGAGHFNPDRK